MAPERADQKLVLDFFGFLSPGLQILGQGSKISFGSKPESFAATIVLVVWGFPRCLIWKDNWDSHKLFKWFNDSFGLKLRKSLPVTPITFASAVVTLLLLR